MKPLLYLLFALSTTAAVMAADKPAEMKLTAPTLMEDVRHKPYPENGSVLSQNPRALIWQDRYPHMGAVMEGDQTSEATAGKPKVAYLVRLSQDSTFKHAVKQTMTAWAIYNVGEPLAEGRWYWQYGYIDGTVITWSPTLNFIVPQGCPRFSPPSFQTLRDKMPNYHPRVWVDKPSWDDFIARNRNNPEAKIFIDKAEKCLQIKLAHISTEIDTSKLASLDNKVKRHSYLIRESRKIVDREELNCDALIKAYMLTRDPRFKQGALDRVLELLSWREDRYFAGDFNSSVLLSITSMSYDAFYDTLTSEQKQTLLQGIRINGAQFFEEFENHLETHIADNHVWQMTLRILTMAAATAYGDLPEAQTWLEYCYNVWLARFPGLNSDGGWHNGDSYFHVNIKTLVEVPFLYSRITGFDFFSDPWYRGNARYVIYQQPPFSKSAGHGNAHETVRQPSAARIGYADALSRECADPYAADYVKRIMEQDPKALNRTFESKSGDLSWYRMQTNKKPNLDPKQGLQTLPNANVFPATGLATFHTNLDNYRNNAMFSFRSSPYGSTSHALADQNGFHTFYGGKPIFYSTGFRTGFTDEHVMYHYRNARSHNTILVDSMSQSIGTDGYGWIPRNYVGEKISYIIGDASNAYGLITTPLWIKRGRLSHIDYTPEHGWDKNVLDTYRRHVVQLGGSGLMMMYDDLKADKPVIWTHQFHTIENPMNTSTEKAYSVVEGVNELGVSTAYIFCDAKSKLLCNERFAFDPVDWLNKGGIKFTNPYNCGFTTERVATTRILTIIDTRGKDAAKVKMVRNSDGSIRCGDWVIRANLSSNGAPSFVVTNASDHIMVNYNTGVVKFDGRSVVLPKAGVTQIVENGRTTILEDEFPELEH